MRSRGRGMVHLFCLEAKKARAWDMLISTRHILQLQRRGRRDFQCRVHSDCASLLEIIEFQWFEKHRTWIALWFVEFIVQDCSPLQQLNRLSVRKVLGR